MKAGHSERTRRRAFGLVGIALLVAGSVAISAHPVQAQLQDSPWPTFGRDKGRAGQSPYLGAQTAELRWTLWLGDKVGSPVIADDGTVYVVASAPYHLGGRTQLHAIDSAAGTIKWSYPPEFPAGPSLGTSSTPTIAADGTIYLTIQDGDRLIAIHPGGTLAWGLWVHPAPYECPAVGDDGTIYAGSFFAVHPDGSERWHGDYGFWHGMPAVAPAPTRYGPAGAIHVAHPVLGQQIFTPDGAQTVPSDLVPLDGDPAIGSDGSMAAVDQYSGLAWLQYFPSNGQPWWGIAVPYDSGHAMQPAIAGDGTIYLATGSPDVRAFAPDGTLKWSSVPIGNAYGTKPAIGADGTVYVHTMTGHYALDPVDGAIKWQNAFDHHTFESSPAIGRDGSVIVGGQYSLYAYKGPPQISELELLRAIPDRGGDAWQVTARIRGDGILDGAVARLVRSGEADIVGRNIQLTNDAGGVGLTTIFDLRGAAPGAWDVVVTNPDGGSASLPGGFTVEAGGSARVWIDLVGRDAIRAGREQVFHVLIGNRGNVDAIGYPMIGGIPVGATWRLDLRAPSPPLTLDDLLTVAEAAGEETSVHLPTMRVPPGATGSVGLWIEVPPNTITSMNLRVVWSEP